MNPHPDRPGLTHDRKESTLTHPDAARLDLDAVRDRFHAILATQTLGELRAALLASLVDIPALVSEVDSLRSCLEDSRRRYADLLAAGRATLAAHQDGDPDPLYYLRDELNAQQGRPA